MFYEKWLCGYTSYLGNDLHQTISKYKQEKF